MERYRDQLEREKMYWDARMTKLDDSRMINNIGWRSTAFWKHQSEIARWD